MTNYIIFISTLLGSAFVHHMTHCSTPQKKISRHPIGYRLTGYDKIIDELRKDEYQHLSPECYKVRKKEEILDEMYSSNNDIDRDFIKKELLKNSVLECLISLRRHDTIYTRTDSMLFDSMENVLKDD